MWEQHAQGARGRSAGTTGSAHPSGKEPETLKPAVAFPSGLGALVARFFPTFHGHRRKGPGPAGQLAGLGQTGAGKLLPNCKGAQGGRRCRGETERRAPVPGPGTCSAQSPWERTSGRLPGCCHFTAAWAPPLGHRPCAQHHSLGPSRVGWGRYGIDPTRAGRNTGNQAGFLNPKEEMTRL